jgi:choline kinase
MKMIILAAGQGTRLRPLTDDKPKCMVAYREKPIINTILETANAVNIEDIAIVSGYKEEILKNHLKKYDVKFYTNSEFTTTNMVSTLFCAKEFMDDDLIVSYADIIYSQEVLQKLVAAPHDFSVVVDTKWRELWNQRMKNPLDDVETLKIENGCIVELGKKPTEYNEIEGQYIGLVKISKGVINSVLTYYESLDKNKLYDGKNFNNMYMTSFIQSIIDNLLQVRPIMIEGGWIEIDCVEDLKVRMVYA